MGQIKKLSSNDVVRVAGVSGRQCKKALWHTSEILVKSMLTLDEFTGVVSAIVQDCIGDDYSKSFMLLDFSFRVNIINAYAYVDLPTDIDTLYYIIYASDLFEIVYKRTNPAQIDAILESARLILQTGSMMDE